MPKHAGQTVLRSSLWEGREGGSLILHGRVVCHGMEGNQSFVDPGGGRQGGRPMHSMEGDLCHSMEGKQSCAEGAVFEGAVFEGVGG